MRYRWNLLGVALAGWVAAANAQGAPPPPTQAEMETAFLGTLHRLSAMLARSPDVVVAEVGTRVVTRGDVADALEHLPPTNGTRTAEAVYADALHGLIAQRVLALRAVDMGIDKEPKIRRLIASGTDQLLANEYLQRAAAPEITDAALKDVYQRLYSAQPGAEEVRARIIMTPSRAQADAILGKLAAGADFPALAAEVSKDATAPIGGDLGYVGLGAVLPEVGAVMFALAPGQISAFPVWAGGVWYIVKVEGRRVRPTPRFEDVRPRLVQQFIREKASEILQQAVKKYPVHEYGLTGKPEQASAPAR